MPAASPADTSALRKARGAFFTPADITEFIAAWAVRSPDDRVLEPSAGDAAFLLSAHRRLTALDPARASTPTVHGVEIHPESAEIGRARVTAAGGRADIEVSDFFRLPPTGDYDTVIGNPPFIRYQGFTGESRARAREAALRGGVALSGLASSWAAFTIHSALFLRSGGRLGLVLPAELLTVNYAAPVRTFLFESFRSVELVLFEEQVFPGAETEVVLLLADGYQEGPSAHATIRQARTASELNALAPGQQWTPVDPAAKWIDSLVSPAATTALHTQVDTGRFCDLETWGDTTLGTVTGNNKYFTLSTSRAAELGLTSRDLMRVSPPGSAHLRGLSLTPAQLRRLADEGKATQLFYPREPLSAAAAAYIEAGERTGVHEAYKCRVRRTWYRVPLLEPADLLLTCMNADTPRLTTNSARARHLNSVHGVYLREEHRELGSELLPLASLNAVTMLHAEIVGRSYGGGILKLEPKEADRWAVPSPALIASAAEALAAIRPRVARLLRTGRLAEASALVDAVLLSEPEHLSARELDDVRQARDEMVRRRTVRGASGR
ncbi:HsdM family class I SAM-dependent methyltransferase [Brevibacterium luteolum]|uniref:HsdM family class I SAM-dependent methyltransferase n=1 Tax=Brevibacterium luteolum TaxID=199591 RepID=UPI00223AAF54|nr:SAM-dependent methyltransferase [Brevibacterium luteolum]MCT1658048.1 SAM-dependent methyltransferase [Brevibacterium luteolum]